LSNKSKLRHYHDRFYVGQADCHIEGIAREYRSGTIDYITPTAELTRGLVSYHNNNNNILF